MKYYVVKVVNNTTLTVVSEWENNLNGAKVSYYGTCETLCNADDVETATVAIIDEELNIVGGYKEYISHPVTKTTKQSSK